MRSVKEEEELELNKEVEGRREEGKTYVVNTYKVHNYVLGMIYKSAL